MQMTTVRKLPRHFGPFARLAESHNVQLCVVPCTICPLARQPTQLLTHSSSLVVHSLLEKEEHMKPTPAYKADTGGDEERICDQAEERKKEGRKNGG